MDHPLTSTYGARLGYYLESADDYHHHRQRLNHRLGKLRKSLGIVTKDTKHYQQKEKVSGISAEDYDSSIRYGDVVLYQIERDLVFAEETQLLLDVHPSKSRRQFVTSKYKKAVVNLKHLLAISEHEKSEFRVLELFVYAAFVTGLLSVNKKRWSSALANFSVARCSLQCLYKHQQVEAAEFNRELYMDLIDNVVDPVLKVATLEGSGSRNPDLVAVSREEASKYTGALLGRAVAIIKKIDPELVRPPTKEDEEEEFASSSITWFSYTAQLQTDEEVKAVGNARKEAAKVDPSEPASFDSALIAYTDAISLHEQEMRRGETYASDEEKQEAEIVLTYLRYNYLLLRIRRDLVLLDEIDRKKRTTKSSVLENARNSIKILDSIVSSFSDISELPGVANEDELSASLSTLTTYFNNVKVFKLAQGYLAADHSKESLALLHKAQESLDAIGSLPVVLDEALPAAKSIEELKEEVSKELRNVHVLVVYNDRSSQYKSKQYVIDNVGKFPEISSDEITKRIAPLDMSIEPVSVKPVLFDIAYNYIGYADKPAPVEKEKETKKKGFFGLFG